MLDAPEFLCYVNGDGSRHAEIVHSKAEILEFISEQWMGTKPDPNEGEWVFIYEDLEPTPNEWGDGIARVQWNFEDGYLFVELLSDHWDDAWEWANG